MCGTGRGLDDRLYNVKSIMTRSWIEPWQARVSDHEIELILIEKLLCHRKGLSAGYIAVSQARTQFGHEGQAHQVLVFDDKGSMHDSVSRSIESPAPPSAMHKIAYSHCTKGDDAIPIAKKGRRIPPFNQT
jgi:hypothetical protein